MLTNLESVQGISIDKIHINNIVKTLKYKYSSSQKKVHVSYSFYVCSTHRVTVNISLNCVATKIKKKKTVV